jgi:glycogen phosphorylase
VSSGGSAEPVMIDVMAKRVSTTKRQILYLFYILLRYIKIREFPRSQGPVGKVLYLVAGRAPHTHFEGKKVIEAVYKIAKLINNCPFANNYMKVAFVPNFNVSTCELFVTAADISHHISTPGTEPSGTSNMKYIMNGGLIVGSRDGANLEIEREVGANNIYLFGSDKNRLFMYQKFVSLLFY